MKNLLFLFFLLSLAACTSTPPSDANDKSEPTPPSEKPTTVPPKADEDKTLIYKAAGTEPFWALSINEHYQMILKTIDDYQLEMKLPVKNVNQIPDGNGAIRIDTEIENGYFTVMMASGKCTDGMSDKDFTYTTQVLLKTEKTGKDVIYKGCGKFYNDFQLNNTWNLIRVNNQAVPKGGEKPHIRFSLLDRKMSGFAGCNYINSKVSLRNGNLKFEPIAVTKRACPDNAQEQIFLTVLNSDQLRYSINGNQLQLTDRENTLIFKAERP